MINAAAVRQRSAFNHPDEYLTCQILTENHVQLFPSGRKELWRCCHRFPQDSLLLRSFAFSRVSVSHYVVSLFGSFEAFLFLFDKETPVRDSPLIFLLFVCKVLVFFLLFELKVNDNKTEANM